MISVCSIRITSPLIRIILWLRFIPGHECGDSSGRDHGSRIRALDGGASSSTRVSEDPVSYGRRKGSPRTDLRCARCARNADNTLSRSVTLIHSSVFRKFATTSPFKWSYPHPFRQFSRVFSALASDGSIKRERTSAPSLCSIVPLFAVDDNVIGSDNDLRGTMRFDVIRLGEIPQRRPRRDAARKEQNKEDYFVWSRGGYYGRNDLARKRVLFLDSTILVFIYDENINDFSDDKIHQNSAFDLLIKIDEFIVSKPF